LPQSTFERDWAIDARDIERPDLAECVVIECQEAVLKFVATYVAPATDCTGVDLCQKEDPPNGRIGANQSISGESHEGTDERI